MARSVAALSFVVLLAVVDLGSCLRCFQCNSQSDGDCMDPFPRNRHIVECNNQQAIDYNRNYLGSVLPTDMLQGGGGIPGAPRACGKIVLQNGNGFNTIRTCLDVNPVDPNQTCRILEKSIRDFPVAGKQLKHCSVCEIDSCNGAGSISASVPAALLALVASYLFYKQ